MKLLAIVCDLLYFSVYYASIRDRKAVPKLTKSFVDKTPIPAKKTDGKPTQVIYRDSSLPGFGLLVGSGGTKSFFVERRVNGKVRRISIGRYGHITPTQARNKAQEILGDIAMGNDPIAKKRARAVMEISLQAAIEDYFRTRKDLKPGTVKTYRVLFKGCIPDWLPKKVTAITKDMIESRHQEIGSRAPYRANNVMRTLRAVFNHAIAKFEDESGNPIIKSNPVDRLSQNRAWYETKRRRDYLRPHELRPWFEATMELSQDVTRDYLQFTLFTGLRRTEAATLTWSQVNFEDGTFTISNTKNKEPHTLPFNSLIKELLQRRSRGAVSKWVFPSPQNDGAYLKDPRGSTDYICEKMGKRITLHDLRRTFITIAESLDIPAYALKRLINHRDPNDVTAGYIISSVDRLREPMEKIGSYMSSNIEGVR